MENDKIKKLHDNDCEILQILSYKTPVTIYFTL